MMEYLGAFAFIMMLFYSSYPAKVKHIEAKVKRMERKQKGENAMSKLIDELKGKECKIKSEDALVLVGSEEMACLVLDTDDEWIKVQFTDKKKNTIIKLLRIENIEEIQILEA